MSTILNENGHTSNNISYLKMDVESSELDCFDDWFKSDIFANVQQLGIEFHIQSSIVKSNFKQWFRKLNRYLVKLTTNYGLQVVSSSPNICVGKTEDFSRNHYAYLDVLFVRSS